MVFIIQRTLFGALNFKLTRFYCTALTSDNRIQLALNLINGHDSYIIPKQVPLYTSIRERYLERPVKRLHETVTGHVM
jgi:hypothetical protein